MPKQSRNLGDMPTSVESSIKDVRIDVVKENADKSEQGGGGFSASGRPNLHNI